MIRDTVEKFTKFLIKAKSYKEGSIFKDSYFSIKEARVTNAINSIGKLSQEEAYFLASSLQSGDIRDVDDVALTLIVQSQSFPNQDFFNLTNYGDSLLSLKTEVILAGGRYALSNYPHENLTEDNFWDIILYDDLKLEIIDLDYILALYNAFDSLFENSQKNKKLSSKIKTELGKEIDNYSFFFKNEGIEALEELKLIKPAKKKFRVIRPDQDYDFISNYDKK